MWTLLHRNTRLLALVVLLIFSAGLSALYVIPRSEDPRMANRYSFVVTQWPGASAQKMERHVTEPIEDALMGLDVVRRFRSTTNAEISTIQIELKGTITNVDGAWTLVRDRLGNLSASLPEGAVDPYLADREESDAYTILFALTWTGPGDLHYGILTRLARELEDRLRMVPGTEYTRLFGAPEEEISVEVESHVLAGLRMTPDGLSKRIVSMNPQLSAGRVSNDTNRFHIEVAGEIDTLDRLSNLAIRVGDQGDTLRLGDFATIRKGPTDPPGEIALFNGKPGVGIGVRMHPGQRVDHWSLSAIHAFESFSSDLSPSIRGEVVFDQSDYVNRSLGILTRNLLIGMALVISVTLTLMGWRAAAIVGVTLPLTVLMVFAGMGVLGIPIHQLSIMGLILALGLLIDNAIIVVDEVQRRLDKGMSKREAISQSCRHLSIPLLGSTLTTVLAFSPLLLLKGGVGDFVGAFAATVVLSLVSSLVLALAVVPSLAVRLMARPSARAEKDSWLRRGIAPAGLSKLFRTSLDWALAHPLYALAAVALLPAVGFVQAPSMDEQFFPASERDQFRIRFKMASGTALAETKACALRAQEVIEKHSEVTRVDWFIGGIPPRIFYNLITWERKSPSFANAIVKVSSPSQVSALVKTLQAELDEAVPEAQIIATPLSQGPVFKAPIELRVEGPDLDVLDALGERARSVLAGVPGIEHTEMSLMQGRPKLSIELDEGEALRAGFRYATLAKALESALEGSDAGSVIEDAEQLPLRVRLAGGARSDVLRLSSLALAPEEGAEAVSLAALGRIVLEPEASAINHNDGVRCNNVYGYTTTGVLPAKVAAIFHARLDASGFRVPPGYKVFFGGEEAERDAAVLDLLAPAALLLLAMGGTLVLAFSSFRLAGVVALVGICAVGFGLGAVWLFGYPFGFMAIVGTMGLVGVAINDSIVVLAAIREEPRARAGDRDAVRESVMRSTRHVVATSVTTIAGFTPLFIAGGEFWPPLAIAMAGGVGGATLLALYFVPSAYVYLFRQSAEDRALDLSRSPLPAKANSLG